MVVVVLLQLLLNVINFECNTEFVTCVLFLLGLNHLIKVNLVSQVLYGEHFKVLEQRKSWSKIRLAFDKYEGWIDNKQYIEITRRAVQRFK